MDELFMSAKDEARAKQKLLESKVKAAILMYREVTKEQQCKDITEATDTMETCIKLVPKA